MGQINKGTIANISGNTARVVPSNAGAKPTAKITIPWHLRGAAGNLSKGTEVVYVEFEDSTGLLLGRADGDWGAYLPKITVDDIIVSDITADNINTKSEKATSITVENSVTAGSVTANGVSLSDHIHGGVEAGDSTTDKPQ